MVNKQTYKQQIAQAGLVTKGLIYSLLGLIAFMAGFNINGHSAKNADKSGVFDFIYKQPGGKILLSLLVLGLICYCVWRITEVFSKQDEDNTRKVITKKARYIFSAFAYATLTYDIIRKLFYSISDSGDDGKQGLAQKLLSQPFGQILTIIGGLIFAGVGIYQVYYGLSDKYKNHVDETVGNSKGRKAVTISGKLGYIARGIVWLLIAFLFIKAAYQANASQAGDTSKALEFLENQAYGSYLLAAIGLGLICYGTFCFVRVRYENFK